MSKNISSAQAIHNILDHLDKACNATLTSACENCEVCPIHAIKVNVEALTFAIDREVEAALDAGSLDPYC